MSDAQVVGDVVTGLIASVGRECAAFAEIVLHVDDDECAAFQGGFLRLRHSVFSALLFRAESIWNSTPGRGTARFAPSDPSRSSRARVFYLIPQRFGSSDVPRVGLAQSSWAGGRVPFEFAKYSAEVFFIETTLARFGGLFAGFHGDPKQ